MISGSKALAEIERAVEKARGEEARLDQALQNALGEVERLRRERTAAFRELARVKLDALRRQEVVGRLDAAERQAVDLLKRQRETVDMLLRRRGESEAALQRAENDRRARAEALESALAEFEDLRARIEEQTRGGPEWRSRRAEADEAARKADAAHEKAAQAEKDREEKRKPYEADSLFMYLWNRRFGTAAYRAGPLARFFDRKVARLVGYDGARANYAMLNEIPLRLREHAERLRAHADAARNELAALERKALVDAGIEPLEAKAAEAKAALDAADDAVAAARAELARLDQAHAEAVEKGDSVPEQAIDLLAAADAQEDLRELYREAQATPTPDDEAIVRRIEATDKKLARAKDELHEIRGKMRAMAKRRAEIEHERKEFRRRGYDNPWGTFPDEGGLQDTLGKVLTGALKGAVLGEILRNTYRPRRTRFDPDFGGGAGFPFPFPRGDNWPGDGPQAPSGDGFRTGGSF